MSTSTVCPSGQFKVVPWITGSNPVLGEAENPDIQTQQQAESQARVRSQGKTSRTLKFSLYCKHQSPGWSQTKVGLHAPPAAADGGEDENLESPRVLLDRKVCQMAQFMSLLPQELQTPKRDKDIGIKEWLLQKEVTCIFYFFPRA